MASAGPGRIFNYISGAQLDSEQLQSQYSTIIAPPVPTSFLSTFTADAAAAYITALNNTGALTDAQVTSINTDIATLTTQRDALLESIPAIHAYLSSQTAYITELRDAVNFANAPGNSQPASVTVPIVRKTRDIMQYPLGAGNTIGLVIAAVLLGLFTIGVAVGYAGFRMKKGGGGGGVSGFGNGGAINLKLPRF